MRLTVKVPRPASTGRLRRRLSTAAEVLKAEVERRAIAKETPLHKRPAETNLGEVLRLVRRLERPAERKFTQGGISEVTTT
jgi:hypothetical protein